MINHKHKFIFIHTSKTAGTSISVSLADASILENETREKHWNASQCKQNYSYYWDKYYKFSVVRNPWDRVVSMYIYFKHYVKSIKQKNFSDWLTFAFVEKKFNIWGGLGSQYDFLAIDGSIDLDYLLRFENLNSDFDKLCKNLDIPGLSLATYNGPFKKDSRHARKHYREYYNEYDMKIIEAVYKKDIDYFDYKF
jgi:hypothetical protein